MKKLTLLQSPSLQRMETKKIKLILGLGNPGSKYDNTRHNIGFEVLDALASKFNLNFNNEKKFSAECASSDITINYTLSKKIKVPVKESIEKTVSEEVTNEDGEVSVIEKTISELRINYKKETQEENKSFELKLILAKPQTYMNDSGKAAVKLMQFYKIKPAEVLVIHDDVSLDTGKLKMAFNSGAGGQHGVEDILEKLGGNKGFHRVKFGVGPDPGGERRADYVLKTFPKAQKELVEETINQAQDLIQAWLIEEDHQQIKRLS